MSDRAVRDGLAELSGVRVCDAPGCDRYLRDGQGRKVLVSPFRSIRTCFTSSCVAWADDQVHRSKTFA